MAYKYKIMDHLANLIRDGAIEPDIDIREVIDFWVKKHPKIKPKKYVWLDKPRFYNRAMTSNNRAKHKGDTNKITSNDLEFIYSRDNGKCLKCNSNKHLVFDHIISYYRGGTNTVDNLQLLCRLCNMEKGASE